MIVRKHLPFRRIWPNVWKRILGLFIFDLAVAVLYSVFGMKALALSSLPLAMIGGALSVFLAFRNNSAYDRWWEARTLWGALVNTARTLSRQVLTLADPPADAGSGGSEDDRKALVELQIAYVHALRCHLRRQNPFPEFENTLPEDVVRHLRTQRNVPVGMLLEMGKRLRNLFDQGRLDSYRFTTIDGTLTDLCNVQGACERIKNTPLPRQYEYFPRLLVGLYSVLLPFGLVDGLGLLTPIASTVVSFIFVSLETVGKDIENPFENTVHDTPMSSLTRAIEVNLRQNMGQQSLPPDVKPVEGFVY
jgi:ion channel-forming bestrophin family protein